MTRRILRLSRWAGGSAALIVIAVAAVVAFKAWHAGAAPTPHRILLADGVEIFFLTGSLAKPAAGYPIPREIHLDGDFFVRVPESPRPLIVRSRLLVLTVSGKAALRVTARSKEAGEQVEVLHGHVKAEKSYPSAYAEPDLLKDGQMTMINRDIDLMEKETADVSALRAWSEALVASASRANAAR